jgi:flagellar hook-associated protein 2
MSTSLPSLSGLPSLTSGSSSTGSSGGIDVAATVNQLMQAERIPEQQMQAQQATLQQQESALKDLQSRVGSLQSAADALKDPTGIFSSVSVQSGDTSIFRVSADPGAVQGMHTVVVDHLASTSTAHSATLPQTSASFTGNTSFDLTIGNATPVTVTFDAQHNTLSAAANYINGLKLGLTASVVNGANGSQLVLTSQTSGAAGQISITNDSTGLGMAQGNKGQNALVTIDGIDVESATNTVADAVPGITLNLVSAAPGREITLLASSDTDRITAAIQNFVAAYNSSISAINSQFQFNTTTNTSGVLAADTMVRDLQQQLLKLTTNTVDGAGAVSSLRQLGITMNDDGTLTLDNATLANALSNNIDGVQTFFQKDGTGFAVQAALYLDTLADPTESPIAVDLQGIEATSQNLTDSINAFELRMAARQQQLTNEYDRIDVMLEQFSSTQQQISQQLASLKTSS